MQIYSNLIWKNLNVKSVPLIELQVAEDSFKSSRLPWRRWVGVASRTHEREKTWNGATTTNSIGALPVLFH